MSDSEHEDALNGEPPTIDPYEVLGLDREATADQVKIAYRKAALKNHPDKVPESKKEEAHAIFQSIAFAYTILSDPARRKRYDSTGSTSESIIDSDDFNWSDYYSQLFKDAVSEDAIRKFAEKYKGSDEEKDDLLNAYEECQGDMDQIYERVILSSVIDDDKRFRKIIDAAIKKKDVESFRAYEGETRRKREARQRAARAEAEEAEDLAKELGVHDKLFGSRSEDKKGKRKGKGGSEDDLAALILQRQKDRSEGFLDRLAEKYGATSGKKKKGKKRDLEGEGEEGEDGEPSEEAFQAAAARLKRSKVEAESSKSTSRPKRSKRS